MGKFIVVFQLLAVIILISACNGKIVYNEKGKNKGLSNTMKDEYENKVIRYVAIGDSYTKGEGAEPYESWAAVLSRHLKSIGIDMELVANPSTSGWTSNQAIEYGLPVLRESNPDFATLQIGVNDWVQGVDEENFRKGFIFLIEEMNKTLPKNRLLVVTIPDFSTTPNGKMYGGGRNISEGILRFNEIIKEESEKRGIKVADIFTVSKGMAKNPILVAKDGLHPSSEEYKIWEEIIYPIAYGMLKRVDVDCTPLF